MIVRIFAALEGKMFSFGRNRGWFVVIGPEYQAASLPLC